jgi:hypothetical protein
MFSKFADRRTVFEQLLAFFEGMSVLANAVQHLLERFAATIREYSGALGPPRKVPQAHTGTLRGRRGSLSFPLVSFLYHTRDYQSYL